MAETVDHHDENLEAKPPTTFLSYTESFMSGRDLLTDTSLSPISAGKRLSVSEKVAARTSEKQRALKEAEKEQWERIRAAYNKGRTCRPEMPRRPKNEEPEPLESLTKTRLAALRQDTNLKAKELAGIDEKIRVRRPLYGTEGHDARFHDLVQQKAAVRQAIQEEQRKTAKDIKMIAEKGKANAPMKDSYRVARSKSLSSFIEERHFAELSESRAQWEKIREIRDRGYNKSLDFQASCKKNPARREKACGGEMSPTAKDEA